MSAPRIYLDNVICSGLTLRDLVPPSEMAASDTIASAAASGRVVVETSRQTGVEQERTKDNIKRADLLERQGTVPRVRDDHKVMGFSNTSFGSFPLVEDVVDRPLLDLLKAEGLKEGDARHLMYAVHHGSDYFVTIDSDFGVDEPGRRALLERHCRGLKIRKPSEIVGLLSL